MGLLCTGFSKTLINSKPDIVLLYGDRSEVLIAATITSLHNIPIGHLQAGDVSGSKDDLFRNAITKLSHIFFVSNKYSKAGFKN